MQQQPQVAITGSAQLQMMPVPMQQQPHVQMQMMVPIVPFVQMPVTESTEDVHRRIHAEGGLKSLSALQTCKIGRREKSHELRYSLAEGTHRNIASATTSFDRESFQAVLVFVRALLLTAIKFSGSLLLMTMMCG